MHRRSVGYDPGLEAQIHSGPKGTDDNGVNVSAPSAGLDQEALTMIPTTPVTPVPMRATATKGDAHPGPQRHLDARLAEAIRAGKERTGLSWRGLAAETGISHAHLNHLSLGKRVPSQRVVGILINALDLDHETAKGLRAVATPTWWERRAELL